MIFTLWEQWLVRAANSPIHPSGPFMKENIARITSILCLSLPTVHYLSLNCLQPFFPQLCPPLTSAAWLRCELTSSVILFSARDILCSRMTTVWVRVSSWFMMCSRLATMSPLPPPTYKDQRTEGDEKPSMKRIMSVKWTLLSHLSFL